MTSQVLPTGQSVSYTYDPAGNMQTFTDGAGTYTYHYNNLEELASLTEPNGKQTNFKYNAEGQRIEIDYPDTLTVKYSWNPGGQLTQYAGYINNALQGTTGYSYEPGPSGTTSSDQLSGLQNSLSGNSAYSYDALNRLTNANTPSANYSYTYDGDGDGDGDMLAETNNNTTTNYAYNNADEQTCLNYNTAAGTCPTGESSTYDTDGNQTQNGSVGIAYNTLDQPANVGGQAYGFFGSGEDDLTNLGNDTLQQTQLGLTASTNNGVTTYFTVAPDGTTIGENVSSGANAGDYYDLASNPQTGTVDGVFNSSGNLAAAQTYDPYGNVTSTYGSGPDDIGCDGAFHQAGSNAYHFGARQYIALNGRWTQPDPDIGSLIADPTQDDPYVFAGDDPVNLVDAGVSE